MTDFLHQNLSEPLPDAARGGVVAIGNFDGVHRGHQAVLGEAQAVARADRRPCYALTFEPHPRTLFKPESPVFRLTPDVLKARLMQAVGMDGLLLMSFTHDLAGTEADDFVKRHLLDAAGATHVVSGFDFHFGKGRAGSPEFLRKIGIELGFGVTIVAPRLSDGEEPFSSSTIRRLLGVGDVKVAACHLGYRWLVTGQIVKGAQLGRTLGYPTANVVPDADCRLAHGIYAVRLRRSDGSLHDGVASFGRRPTFDNGAPVLETFIFDFDDDLYGETVEVSLFERLRGEEKFDDVSALIAQMDKDSTAAKAALAAAQPLSQIDSALCFQGLRR
ncbi:MAG: bifunctional riboflavin kinase/FAD synthetase [Ahrensia sp.]|nr:bifunctional riboflavin kinase/FAD synthetase [Ahrensia sp.]